MPEILPTHVLIGNVAFSWAEKAPYTSSGKSVLGAIEFNEIEDLVKCHVCGKWVKHIGLHLRGDGVSSQEYRRDAGLRSSSHLMTPSQAHKRHIVGQGSAKFLPPKKEMRQRMLLIRPEHSRSKDVHRGEAETRNLRSLCDAQIRSRLLCLGSELGRTPTSRDCIAAGMDPRTIKASCGMAFSDVIESLGFPATQNFKQPEIKKDIPIPRKRKGRRFIYPFNKLKIGESFFVPLKGSASATLKNLQTVLRTGSSRRLPLKFEVHRQSANPVGVRVWRTK